MYDMFIGMIKEDTISTVIEELAYNLKLSFSLLSNAKPNLRQLSATIILSVTRSIVSSSCPDSYKPLKITLSKLLQDAFDECLDKKNSRISLKFFEDCLERSTEFTTRALLSRLVRGTIDGKTPYLRSECCKIVSVILKKKESQFEDKDITKFIIKECLHLAKNIGRALSTSSSSSLSSSDSGISRKDSDHRTKRIKPILLCIKDLSLLLKSQQTSKTTAKSSTKMATTELGKAVKTVSGINPNLKQLVEQILANLGENESKGDDNKNGDDNVNAKDKSNNKRKKGDVPISGKTGASEVEKLRDWSLEDENEKKARAVKRSKFKAN